MNKNQITCDPQRIELFLGQQLSGEEQTAFELHLDDCDDCRHRLEAAAADDDVWAGVRDSLAGRPLPPDGLRPNDPPVDSGLDLAADGDTPFGHETVLKLLAPTDDDRMIGRLGTYEVMGVIGSGGMGVVLKAFDPALNRYVAIKVLAPHLGSSGAARKRFSREAQAAAAVVHDNAIEIHGVADTDGLPYLVMPYVRGPSLQRRLDDEGPLEPVEILRIAVQAATGLAAAHAQGLVHRDVKPANILLADGVERVKLTDFGLARAADDASLTRTGIIAGTPQYMSPEQARGESVDHRSDLFGLGSVLYAMSTGRAPFRAETSYGVLRRVTDDEPRSIREINPDVPEWLCRIIARLMSKQPEERFESAAEVAELLEECLAHVQQPTAVPLPASLAAQSKGNRFFSIPGRRLGVIAMTATFSFALLGMFVWPLTSPPDISGRWAGEGWNQVVLEEKQAGTYEGTYSDTFGEENGKIQLKWSRIERRFKGAWGEGEDRFGKIAVRLVGDEIRGAWTTNEESRIQPGRPELADLLWTRVTDRTPGGNKAAPTVAITPQTEPEVNTTAAIPPATVLDRPKTTAGAPKRVLRFTTLTTGNGVKVACSADGKSIAVANGNPTRIMQSGGTSRVKDNWKPSVDVLDAETGKIVVSLKLSTADEDAVFAATERLSHFEATALAFSPDGKVLAIGTNVGQVKLFNPRTGELLRLLDDKQARLADEKTPENWKSLTRAMGGVASLAFSPDGSLLVVCGTSFGDYSRTLERYERLGRPGTGPGRLKVWEVATGALKHNLAGHSLASVVAVSPDGHLLASAGRWSSARSEGTGVILWNLRTGSKIRSFGITANGGVRSVAFSPDGKLLAVGTQRFDRDSDTSTGAVSLIHATSGITDWLVTVPGWAKPVAFSPDGWSVAVLCGGQSIRFLEVETGKPWHEISSADSPQGGRWHDFAIAPRGDLLAIAWLGNERRGGVELWGFSRPAATAGATPAKGGEE